MSNEQVNDENACPQQGLSRFGQSNALGAMKVFGSLVANAVDASITSVSHSPGMNRKKYMPRGINASNCNELGRRALFSCSKDNKVANSSNPAPAENAIEDAQEPVEERHPLATVVEDEVVDESNQRESNMEPHISPKKRKRSEKQRNCKNVSSDDRFKQMQEAVDSASESVNESLRAVRRAREDNLRQNAREAAKLKEQRLAERNEIEAFNSAAEQQRRELLNLKSQRMKEYQVAKVSRDRRVQKTKLQMIDEESNFKSEVHRDHKQTLKEAEDRRRRQSTEVRSKIRTENRIGKDRMRMAHIQEEGALLEERHESSVALRTSKETGDEARRKSLAFRNGDAHRIRELYAQLHAEELQSEHDGYELKWAGEKDAEEYTQKCEEDRRNSFAFRNQHARQVREVQEGLRTDEVSRRQQSNELKWAGDKDAEEYKRRCDQDRRDSFAFRNQEGRRIRETADNTRTQTIQDRQQSNELKWAGEKDAEQYTRLCADERRESLAFRNKEGYRIRQKEENNRTEELFRRQQSNELKWAGEKDAEEYTRKCEQERRDSLVFRNQEARRVREVEENKRTEEIRDRQKSNELKWAGEKDAEEYTRQCDRERRESLSFRNQEGGRHRAVMEELITLSRQQEHESLVLKWAGEDDVKQYLSEVESDRRASFNFRNQEARRVRQLEQEMNDVDINRRADEENLQAACK
jgi:hypothetical protein